MREISKCEFCVSSVRLASTSYNICMYIRSDVECIVCQRARKGSCLATLSGAKICLVVGQRSTLWEQYKGGTNGSE